MPFSSLSLVKLFSGDLAPLGGPVAPPELKGYLRAEQLALIVRNSGNMMLANISNAIVLMVALSNSPMTFWASIWGMTLILLAVGFGLRARFTRRIATPQSVSARSIRRLIRNAFLLGCLWAVIPVMFFAGATTGAQLVMTCLCAGMLAGGALALASVPVAAIVFVAPILLGTAIFIGRNGDFTYALVAILLTVYAAVLIRLVLAQAFEFARGLLVRAAAEKAVRQDSLTHLPNRFAFNEALTQGLSRLSLCGKGFTMVLIDLDRFNDVNSRCGHAAGDDLLTQVAARLRRIARENDTLARMGIDEFALIVADTDTVTEAFATARQLREAFTAPFLIGGEPYRGEASFGIAIAPRDGADAIDLVRYADVALARAKKAGSNAIRFYEPGDDAAARARQALRKDLEGAVARNELFLVYQPLLHLSDNSIAGFEALLRWNHPDRGLVPPIDFIGIAEESGLIHRIGDWVIRQACADLANWPDHIRIAVNFSAAQLQHAGALPGVVGALADAGISPSRLEIEVTESMLISNYVSAANALNALISLGVTVALDDFGTGFSSLTYLRKLPFSRIKIDQSFVADMLTQPDSAAIVKSVLGLARDMGIGVVAEGVETREQCEHLRANQCDEVQGWYIGRPVPAADVPAVLARYPARATRAA